MAACNFYVVYISVRRIAGSGPACAAARPPHGRSFRPHLDPARQQVGVEWIGQALSQGKRHRQGLAETALPGQCPRHQGGGAGIVRAQGERRSSQVRASGKLSWAIAMRPSWQRGSIASGRISARSRNVTSACANRAASSCSRPIATRARRWRGSSLGAPSQLAARSRLPSLDPAGLAGGELIKEQACLGEAVLRGQGPGEADQRRGLGRVRQ